MNSSSPFLRAAFFFFLAPDGMAALRSGMNERNGGMISTNSSLVGQSSRVAFTVVANDRWISEGEGGNQSARGKSHAWMTEMGRGAYFCGFNLHRSSNGLD